MTRKKVNGLQLPSGAPLVVAEGDDDMLAIKESGLSIAYFLGALPGKTVKDEGTPRVFRVVRNLVGYAITAVEEDELGLLPVNEHAWFQLPKIPRTIIRDLDAFFRKIYEKLGTEAIVLLTYDPAKLGKDDEATGWGVLTPKQANGAGSCDYDPASVVDDKPDGHMIVGSVHSHPGMSAFASHTDVQDQANFDGLHITFGWPKGAKVTEYHIEMQMGGGRFTCTEDMCFEDVYENPPGEMVDEWITKVEKAKPKTYNYSYPYNQSAFDKDLKDLKLPKNKGVFWPEPRKEGVVVTILDKERNCPACGGYLDVGEQNRRRCADCMCFLAHEGEEMDDVIKDRWKFGKYGTPELRHTTMHPYGYFWKRWFKDGKYEESCHKVDLWDLEDTHIALVTLPSGKA